MPREVYRDIGFATGTHHGADGAAALYDPDVQFEIIHALDRLLSNETQETSGLVTAQTLDTATAAGVTWNSGDEYILYVGATPRAVLSSYPICRKSGLSVPVWEMIDGEHKDWRDVPRSTRDIKE